MTTDILITGTTTYDPASGAVTPDTDVAIRGDRLAWIGAAGTGPTQAKEVIDGTDRVVMPGLVNTHAHSSMTLLRGVAEDVSIESWFNDIIWRMETNLTAEDAYWGALLAALEMTEAGVTSVTDHYLFMDAVAPAFAESGMRAYLAPTMFGTDADAELGAARDFHAQWNGAADGRITAWFGPHSSYLCSAEFLQQARAAADEVGSTIHLHVSETADQVTASLDAHGLTPPEFLENLGVLEGPTLFAHAAHATSSDLELMATKGVGVAHCPKTFLKLASGILNVVEASAAGVRIGLGSDGVASNATMDILEQARLAALLQKHQHGDATVLTVDQALTLATAGGAAALGAEPAQLQVGGPADVILVDTSGPHVQPLHNTAAALLYSARAADVRTTIVAGKILMLERQHQMLDRERIIAQATERGFRLAATPASGQLQQF